MLTAKDIIEMEESIIHPPEPRKRSDTLHEGSMSSSNSLDWNPALVARRSSVPMEIIIGGDGKPIFTASSNSTVGSPVLPERRSKKIESRSGSKKRNGSIKKKANGNGGSEKPERPVKGSTRKKEVVEKEKESPDSPPLSNSMATCSIGAPTPPKSKNIEHLPEYELIRTEPLVMVRDAVVQTDLF